jgi:hypothetical protein
MTQDRRQALKTLATPLVLAAAPAMAAPMTRSTTVSIEGNAFHINGRPTYPGRLYKDRKVEGLRSPPGW